MIHVVSGTPHNIYAVTGTLACFGATRREHRWMAAGRAPRLAWADNALGPTARPGQQALGIIEQKPGVTLDPSEAASIALRIIDNSERGGAAIDDARIFQGVEGVAGIIQRELGMAASKDAPRGARSPRGLWRRPLPARPGRLVAPAPAAFLGELADGDAPAVGEQPDHEGLAARARLAIAVLPGSLRDARGAGRAAPVDVEVADEAVLVVGGVVGRKPPVRLEGKAPPTASTAAAPRCARSPSYRGFAA